MRARVLVGGRRFVSSIIWAAAIEQWRTVRADYQLWLEAHYAEALEATNGVFLNKRGRDAGIDPFTLFKGPAYRVTAYASDELRDFFTQRPRITFEEYERGYFAMELEAIPGWDEPVRHGG